MNWARKLVDRSSDLNPRNMRVGMYAWLIQRLSGLYLTFFLLTHIMAIAQANFGITTGSMAQSFDILRNPFWTGGTATIIFDLLALGIIAFHGVNGVRIVLLDLGLGVRKHKLVFSLMMIVAAAGTAFIIAFALPLLHGG